MEIDEARLERYLVEFLSNPRYPGYSEILRQGNDAIARGFIQYVKYQEEHMPIILGDEEKFWGYVNDDYPQLPHRIEDKCQGQKVVYVPRWAAEQMRVHGIPFTNLHGERQLTPDP